VLNEINSGGASVNDAYFHASIPTLAFGGVGDSGQGAYRGKASFDTFTHRRSVTTTPGWIESLISVRYPPYAGKIPKYRQMSELKPDFDRSGKEIKGLWYWLGFVLTLGGASTKSVLSKFMVAVLALVGVKRYVDVTSLPNYLR
jgi:beta-apo-4'-carotenal oxygenase